MTTGITVGLLCQALALTLIWIRLRKRWTHHLGAIFVVVACMFHGVGEILIHLFPGQSIYRPLIQNPADLSEFVSLVGVTILIFTVVYLVTLGPITNSPSDLTEADLAATGQFLDWRILGLAAVPLVVLTARGIGYNGLSNANGSLSTATGLTDQFTLLVVPIFAFSVVARHGRRWLMPMLCVDCGVLSLIGQREQLIIGAIALLYAAGRYSIHLSRRQLLVGLVIVAAGALIVSSSRANTGRSAFQAGGGTTEKLQSLGRGVTGAFDSATRAQLRFTAGYRLDGNTWGALVLENYHEGGQPAGPGSLVNDLRDAVPSFLDPQKNDHNPADLLETTYQGLRMNLPEDSTGAVIGLPPTELGTILGYWGIDGLLPSALVLGAMFGLLDRWLATRRTPASLLFSVGLVVCVGSYEHPTQEYFVMLRGVLACLVVIKAAQWFKSARPLSPKLSRLTTSAGGLTGLVLSPPAAGYSPPLELAGFRIDWRSDDGPSC